MLKLRDFKDHGYTVSKCTESSSLEASWAKYLIQKGFRDDSKLKYYINIYYYDTRLWDIPYLELKKQPGHTVKVQLYRNDITLDISISKDNWNCIEDFEYVVHEIWCNLDLDYDHHND